MGIASSALVLHAYVRVFLEICANIIMCVFSTDFRNLTNLNERITFEMSKWFSVVARSDLLKFDWKFGAMFLCAYTFIFVDFFCYILSCFYYLYFSLSLFQRLWKGSRETMTF